jgi:hypothetical protein
MKLKEASVHSFFCLLLRFTKKTGSIDVPTPLTPGTDILSRWSFLAENHINGISPEYLPSVPILQPVNPLVSALCWLVPLIITVPPLASRMPEKFRVDMSRFANSSDPGLRQCTRGLSRRRANTMGFTGCRVADSRYSIDVILSKQKSVVDVRGYK